MSQGVKAMVGCNGWRDASVLAALCCLLAGAAQAAEIRFHYVPIDGAGNTTLRPIASSGTAGEKLRFAGTVRRPFANQPRPTHLITFRHPYTGCHITVPLAFPAGTPLILYRSDRIVYDYTGYTVEAHFLPDGAVDVVYKNGLLQDF